MKIVIALLISLLVLSCAEKEVVQNEQTTLEAYRLIDSNRTLEAIELLESRLENDPNNYEFKVALSSAYAHLAGFKIAKLVPIITSAENLQKVLKQKKIDDEADQIPTLRDGEPKEKKIKKSSWISQVAAFSEVYQSIPDFRTKADQVFLSYAIRLLDDLGENVKPSEAIYKVALRIVLIKSLISKFELESSDLENDCKVDVQKTKKVVTELSSLTLSGFKDLLIARPKDKLKIEEVFNSFQKSVLTTQKTLDQLSLANELTKVNLAANPLTRQFSQIFLCQN